ncbi:ribonuclease HI family protein [Fructilactobacillus fructivorans]|uniref:Ribonuclease HI n=1 Tax=Fructilactobacillus fructivorans TaxID=1614 RepID=A0A0C1Q1S0_9LACO|nr:ribonuclease HI family protein [Fructilactobacillus fructivorans]KID41773.1 Ribonuclease HI [Fructilactobacillus fructivorans]MCT0151906.1 reverse transcriptase-like protein [Fructilactobacillus fructivorans]MCT2868143.1 reverse transcriptase-like protein [Fructilactobacillus fructivorans]MCT2869415.1 reverse transcriptase-like protein [Fructilactobacillus fructivorans]MCT2874115.1 reverse transcriptase-like protein [Fructilactobacillus fructivorans]
MYKLYSDAAIKPQSHQCGIGILIVHKQEQLQIKKQCKAKDNHVGEFKACIEALKDLQHHLRHSGKIPRNVTVLYYTDSSILSDSINKQYAKHYQKYIDQIIELESHFAFVLTKWIPDNQNMGAHELAFQALHSS